MLALALQRENLHFVDALVHSVQLSRGLVELLRKVRPPPVVTRQVRVADDLEPASLR